MLRLRFHLGCQIFRIFNLWKYTFSVKDETIPLNITVFLFPLLLIDIMAEAYDLIFTSIGDKKQEVVQTDI